MTRNKSKMLKVKFNLVDEFCDELKKDFGPHLEHAYEVNRRIVRVTGLTRPSSMSPNIRHHYVSASYSIQGQVIRLEQNCGELWGISTTDKPVLDKEKEITDKLTQTIKELGLEQRAGILEG